MTPKKAIELLTKEKSWWVNFADNDDAYWTAQEYLDAYEMAIETIKNAELYEQIKWERDVAIDQLKGMGLSLGEKTSDKYRWHDLRKNPEDVPNDQRQVYVACEYELYETDFYPFCEGTLAWREIEPFVTDINVGSNEVEE